MKNKLFTILLTSNIIDLSNNVFCELANLYVEMCELSNTLKPNSPPSFDALTIQQIQTKGVERGIKFIDDKFVLPTLDEDLKHLSKENDKIMNDFNKLFNSFNPNK